MTSPFAILIIVSPLAWTAGGLICRAGTDYRQESARRVSLAVGVLALLGAIGAVELWSFAGSATLRAAGALADVLSFRIDAVSVPMSLLISFVGVVVVRFSHSYLSGDHSQARFLACLCQTLAAVSLLVVAGNVYLLCVAWIAMSLSLHRLLLFYPERPRARLAARKKFFVARCSDLALLVASVMLVARTGTADIAEIASRVGDPSLDLTAPAMWLVLAALLKSAQFPFHGWLAEVMEAPTPVSALLHAGIVNAGGFLMIRFADLVSAQGPALYTLLFIGGITALFGSLAMLTQRTIKGALAHSTMAQMGFMLLQCGLGAFSSAMLHILAHSLYKAHAFLASGSVVDVARGNGSQATAPPLRLALLLMSLAVVAVVFFAWSLLVGMTLAAKPAIVGLGAILVFGSTHLVVQSCREDRSKLVFIRAVMTATVVAGLYFTLQALAALVFEGAVPPAGPLDPVQTGLMVLMLVTFGVVTVLQWYLPGAQHSTRWRSFWVHLSNGFYVNQLINQFMALRGRPTRPQR